MNEKKERLKVLDGDDDLRNFNLAFKVILIIALFIITFSLFSGIFAGGNLNSSGVNDLEYLIEGNDLFNLDTSNYTHYFNNSKGQTEYTKDYNATYSFLNEEDGTSGANIPFIDGGISGTDSTYSAIVIASEGGHNKIIQFNASGDNGAYVQWEHTISPQTNQLVEFWIKYIDNGVGHLNLYLKNEIGAVCVSMYFDSTTNQFTCGYGNGAGGHTWTSNGAIADIWHHIKISFDCGTDKHSIWLNGDLFVDNELFYDDISATTINEFRVRLNNGAGVNTLNAYIDAFGNSWDPFYNIGDNIIPLTTTNTSTIEIDTYSFSYTEAGVYTIAEDYIPFWTEINGSDDAHSSEEIKDGHAELYSDSIWDVGFYKDDFTLLDGFIDVTWTIYYDAMNVIDGLFYLNIYSEDTTLKTRLRYHIWGTEPNLITTLSYYDGSDYNNITTLYEQEKMNFTLTLNTNNLIVLRNETETLKIFTGIDTNLGLTKIEFIGQAGANGDAVGQNRYQTIELDYVGIYSNGSSLSKDFMSHQINTNITWDSNIYNLFTTNIEGNCSIVADGSPTISPTQTLYSEYSYSTEQTINVWDLFTGGNEGEGWESLPNMYLVFVTNNTLIFNKIEITGAKLTEGNNTYYFDYIYGSVNPNNSYFYVSGNNLHWTLTVNDNNTEFIQASVDLPDVSSENRSISVGSNIDGEPLGYFGVNYTDDTITLLEFPYYYSVQNLVLPQTKMIGGFTILITDGGFDDDGQSTGYITLIKLIYYPDVSVVIATTNLLVIIIPLIVILTPTFAIYTKFGKNSIVPMIMLMSVICFATQLIPTWLFFVILLCSGGFLFMRQRGSMID